MHSCWVCMVDCFEASSIHPQTKKLKAFSYSSFESFNDISCISEHWKATVALLKIMTTMMEKSRDEKSSGEAHKRGPRKVKQQWAAATAAQLASTAIFYSYKCCSFVDIVQSALHTNRFFALLHYFLGSTPSSPTYSLTPLFFCSAFCTFMQVQRSIPSL